MHSSILANQKRFWICRPSCRFAILKKLIKKLTASCIHRYGTVSKSYHRKLCRDLNGLYKTQWQKLWSWCHLSLSARHHRARSNHSFCPNCRFHQKCIELNSMTKWLPSVFSPESVEHLSIASRFWFSERLTVQVKVWGFVSAKFFGLKAIQVPLTCCN